MKREHAARQRAALRRLLGQPEEFIWRCAGLKLRSYQREVCAAVADSVLAGRGLSLVVMFPRQSGKNELQAQLEAYLLTLFSRTGAEIVKISPTWRPQSINAMARLERVLERNRLTAGRWKKEHGYIYRLGQARIAFLSGEPTASIVGATASTLLEVDEAQDVLPDKYDKDIAPMAASTNATRVFWGTAWTAQTLLARELRAAREAERIDGRRRAWVVDADQVAAEVPAYGAFVAAQVARLGRMHPLVRTQFYSEEIEAGGGMFPPERRERMRGSHAPLDGPRPGMAYAFLLDVAGADEVAGADSLDPETALQAGAARRDATALTVVEVDPRDLAGGRGPVYRAVARRMWVGTRHVELYDELVALAGRWQARHLVVDATGVGAGLASFLGRALPGRVIPFTFTAASKSKLGWDFLALADSGRWQEAAVPETAAPPECVESDYARLSALFFRQLAACQYQALPGPGRALRWGVPDGARDPLSGERLRDDLVLSAALVTVLDGLSWSAGLPAAVLRAPDPLEEMDRGW